MKQSLAKSTRETDVAIGTTIRTLRKQAGLSQERLAAAIGVTFQQVQKYEKGTNRVAVSTLIAICHALGAEPMAIIGPAMGEVTVGQSAAVLHLHNRLAVAEERLEAIKAIAGGKLPVVSGAAIAAAFDLGGSFVTQ
ncbi:helix-turn-helix transcriptional regulator [Agrobacterium rhizogenes]|nr:helix-turn-helix transcriptional regulator [Rhizobium rhizogenes]NTJ83338.1 helix-turn-helix transcriptional regulator [Rhizobium rhizogenes]